MKLSALPDSSPITSDLMLFAATIGVLESCDTIYTAVSHKPNESEFSSFFNSYSSLEMMLLTALFSIFSVIPTLEPEFLDSPVVLLKFEPVILVLVLPVVSAYPVVEFSVVPRFLPLL